MSLSKQWNLTFIWSTSFHRPIDSFDLNRTTTSESIAINPTLNSDHVRFDWRLPFRGFFFLSLPFSRRIIDRLRDRSQVYNQFRARIAMQTERVELKLPAPAANPSCSRKVRLICPLLFALTEWWPSLRPSDDRAHLLHSLVSNLIDRVHNSIGHFEHLNSIVIDWRSIEYVWTVNQKSVLWNRLHAFDLLHILSFVCACVCVW